MKKTTFHHRSLTQGYVSVKQTEGIKKPYDGKFGVGYTIRHHNPNSTRYCWLDYYIEDANTARKGEKPSFYDAKNRRGNEI